MKTFKHIVLAFTALLLVASCAIDEMWEGVDTQDEEKVLTFRPKFEDFESVTKAIGDASKVDKLLVQVYEQGGSQPISSTEYEKSEWGTIAIPFYYGKKYEVYFWAYNSEKDPYTIGENGLEAGVSVEYPDGALSYDALENLDAFYAIKEIDLSSNDDSKVNVSLTRPFAQVNLVADMTELETAKAAKVEFKIKVAAQFDPDGSPSDATLEKTFTFTSNDNFKNNEVFDGNNVYLGTTYLFVPSSGKLSATLSLYDSEDNILKGPSAIEIPVEKNKRTNLVFSGIQPAVPEWDENEVKIPEATDDWIHITRPEQLAALLLAGISSETKVHLCNDIDMSGMPEGLRAQIVGKSFANLILDGGKYDGHVMENGTLLGRNVIKKYTGSAFLATASGVELKNITFDNVAINSESSHVGVLVNTLSGENTFKNVTIQNSSATTTTGAAGGMVGYIVRASENDRAETLSVTIDGCKVNNTSASGTLAEGKFVGLLSGYDNGEQLVFTSSCSTDANTSVTDWSSPYKEGNEGAWLASNNYASYDGWLGDEVYYRGKVYFGGTDDAANRFCPKWDGEKSVEPIFEDSNKKIAQIWSAFDLAYLQGKDMTTINFKSNVDMVGICDDCREARANPCSIDVYLNNSSHICSSCPDELYVCKDCIYFTPIKTINNIDGDNHTIYNLNIQQQHNEGSSWGAGFVNRLNSGTVKNLTFEKAYIKCIDTHSLRNDPKNGGNAYAGTLASRTGESANITITNVHANNGYITAVSKFGGLLGYVHGSLNASQCSVNNYTIENNKINVINTYEKSVSISSLGTFSVTAEFYTEGEAGGFIGFLTSGDSVISDCHVNNAIMKCYGQPNQTKYISGKLLGFIPVNYPYNIAGRHINSFIGDIRTVNQETITITSCSATHTLLEGYDYNINSKGKGEIIGCCYIVGVANIVGDKKGKVVVDGESMNFVGD